MADRMVAVVLKNWTRDAQLKYIASSVSHGEWDVSVPAEVPPQTIAAWSSESNGFLTGTEGQAQFQIGSDPSSVLTLTWDNPYAGSNSFSGTAPAPYSVAQQGGVGDIAVVVFTLTKS